MRGALPSFKTGAVGRARLPAIALGACACLLGCSSSNGEAEAKRPGDDVPLAPESPCAEGFALDADGACMDDKAPAVCPGGTRPRLGSSTCEPVGWKAACPTGATRDASGFGCSVPATAVACEGATRESYGQASCAPIGDCAAAFPPAGALVVDAALSDAQLDATHFRTLASAIAAAGDAATIAVDAGVYEEAVTAARPVTVVGRCAAKVELRSPASSTLPGVDVRAKSVTLRGLTLVGHAHGVAVSRTGGATLQDLVVRDARNAGIYVEGGTARLEGTKIESTHPLADGRGGFALTVRSGANATVMDSTLTGGVQGVYAVGTDTKLDMTRVVITKQAPDPSATVRPAGIAAVVGAHVSVTRSVLRDLVGDGAAAVEDDATLELNETIVRGVGIDGSAARGYGLFATYGGHIIARSTMVSAIEGLAILARDEGSSLELVDSAVIGPSVTALPAFPLVNDGRGAGVTVRNEATATLDGVVVVGTWALGVDAEKDGKLDMKRSFIDAPRGLLGAEPADDAAYGLVVTGAVAAVSDVTITRCSAAGINVGKSGRLSGDRVLVRDVIEGSVASSGSGLAVGEAGFVDLDASVVDAATSTGVLVTRGGNSFVRLARSAVHGTRMTRDGYGHGVTVRLDARVVLTDTSLVDNPGIGVAADGGRALVAGGAIARNAVGIHAQSGSFLVELDDADADSLADGEVRVAPSTHFAANATRVGSGVIALPSPILK